MIFESATTYISKNIGKFYSNYYRGRDTIIRTVHGNLLLYDRKNSAFLDFVDFYFLSNLPRLNVDYLSFSFKSSEIVQETIGINTYYYLDFKNADLPSHYFYNNKCIITDAEKIVVDPYLSSPELVNGLDYFIDFYKDRIYFTANPFTNPSLTPYIKSSIGPDYTSVSNLKLFFKNVKILNEYLIGPSFDFISKNFKSNFFIKNLTSLFSSISSFNNTDYSLKELMNLLANIFEFLPENAYKLYYPHILTNNNSFDKISLSKKVLFRSDGTQYSDDLTFLNQDLPATIATDRYEFQINGNPADVADFWNTVYNRGILNPPTLRDLVEQYYGYLPTTMNPFKFFVTHIIRNGWFILELDKNLLSKNESIKVLGDYLSKCFPRHLGLLILLNDNNIISSFILNRNVGNELYSAL